MAKYVKCVDNSGIPFTKYNCYTVINEDAICYLLRDDGGLENWWNKGMFDEPYEEPYEVPEPVIFNSQEEFENAVMEVVVRRLQVKTSTYDLHGRKITDYPNKSICIDKEDLL